MTWTHLCWSHSAVSCRCMQITLSNQSGNHSNQYPATHYWKYCSVLRSWTFPEGDVLYYWCVTGCHLKNPMQCSREHHLSPRATWASIADDSLSRHQNWSHQHWLHVVFADELVVSLYQCDDCARVFEMLVNCFIQYSNEIRGHHDQSRWGWPGLIIEYRMRPVLMVPVWRPICQHAAMAAIIRSLFGA